MDNKNMEELKVSIIYIECQSLLNLLQLMEI